MKKSLREISTQIRVCFRVFSMVVDESCDSTHECTRVDVAGQIALLCDEAIDSCALGDIGHPVAVVPVVPETRDHEVESVGALAIEAHLSPMMVGDVLLDACGFLFGAFGIFMVVFVHEEVLNPATASDRRLRCFRALRFVNVLCIADRDILCTGEIDILCCEDLVSAAQVIVFNVRTIEFLDDRSLVLFLFHIFNCFLQLFILIG